MKDNFKIDYTVVIVVHQRKMHRETSISGNRFVAHKFEEKGVHYMGDQWRKKKDQLESAEAGTIGKSLPCIFCEKNRKS